MVARIGATSTESEIYQKKTFQPRILHLKSFLKMTTDTQEIFSLSAVPSMPATILILLCGLRCQFNMLRTNMGKHKLLWGNINSQQ